MSISGGARKERDDVNMCGIRECLALLQWMTNGKATKREGDEEDDVPPRPVENEKYLKDKEPGKWGVRGGEEKGRR